MFQGDRQQYMEYLDYLSLNGKTIKSILKTFQSSVKEFEKGSMILEKSIKEDRLCLLTKGTAYLCVENENGDRQLLDFFTKGHIMCHEMLPAAGGSHSFIYAKYPCCVAYLSSEQQPQQSLSGLYRALLLARNEHCHMLQQKTTRGKLLAFLHYQSARQQSAIVHVPIPYSDLADYLTIDRSSLMTELRRMDAEGLIKKKRHEIWIREQGEG